MLTEFFNSTDFKNSYEISFSYRYSKMYESGFLKKVNVDFKIYTIRFYDLYDFSILPKIVPKLILRFYFLFARIFFYYPLLIFEIVKLYFLFKKIKPHILHINNGGYPSALSCRAAAIAGKIAKIPNIIMVVNNMAVRYNTLFRFLDYPIDKIVVHSVNHFVTGSIVAKNRIIDVLKLKEIKVISIHNGITKINNSFSRSEMLTKINQIDFKGLIFGTIGLLIPRKGHFYLLDAVKILKQSNKIFDIKFLIVGDGPLRSDLESYIKSNQLDDFFIFVGQVDDVVNYISIMDALILPSVENEDFPFVILEAMSHGKPIISTKIAGTVEQVINNVNGLLVDTKNAVQLADAIFKIYNSKDLRLKMSDESITLFRNNFESKTAINNYIKIYKNKTIC